MRVSGLPRWAGLTARITAFAALFTMLVLCCGFMGPAFEWRPVGGSAEAPRQDAGSLPAKVGAPSPWTPDGLEAPIGAASVLYTSNTWFGDESGHLTGLVGREDDIYRVTDLYGPAGMSSVLSPDGGRVAADVGVTDLATGKTVATYPEYQETDDRRIEPQAWSPDGKSVAILIGWWNDHGGPDDGVQLKVFDVGSGVSREIAELSPMAALSGWTVAFSPDGSRLAFQVEDRIRVFTLADGKSADLPLPAGARIAGKGAWTRDGRSLLVVSGETCDCPGYPRRWTVRTISAADGAVTGPSWTRDGVYALRVLGWWRSGRPVAVEYTATRAAVPSVFNDPVGREELTSQDGIEVARLIELGTGARLLAGDEIPVNGDIESIDVADQVLAGGRTRPGSPPLFDLDALVLLPFTVVITGLVVLLFLGAWALAARWWPASSTPASDESRLAWAETTPASAATTPAGAESTPASAESTPTEGGVRPAEPDGR